MIVPQIGRDHIAPETCNDSLLRHASAFAHLEREHQNIGPAPCLPENEEDTNKDQSPSSLRSRLIAATANKKHLKAQYQISRKNCYTF